MPNDNTQVRVGVTGKLYVAAVGTTFPASTAAAWTGFVDLGYLNDPGPMMTPSVATNDIMAWQAFFPVRTVNTGRTMEWKFGLLQTTGTNLKLAFGGGTITSLGGGDYKYDPPAPGTVDERALGLEITDGSIVQRWLLDRAILSNINDLKADKANSIMYEVAFRALDANSGKPWRVISNDAAFNS